MKFEIITIISFIFLFQLSIVQAQNKHETGRPFLKNYSPNEYQLYEQNNCILQDVRGLIIIGNRHGVVEYDGENFELIKLPRKMPIHSMEKDADGRIYVGSIGAFGYLEPDTQGKLKYISLSDSLQAKDRKFDEVSGIKVLDNTVFFRTSEKLFVYHNNKIDCIDAKTQFFSDVIVDNQYYVNQEQHGLTVFTNNKLEYAAGGLYFRDKEVILSVSEQHRNVLISNAGFYGYYPNQNITKIKTIKTKILPSPLETSLTSAIQIGNNEIALGIPNKGCVITNTSGDFFNLFDIYDGLQNNTINDIEIDLDNALWLALDEGFARIENASPISFWNSENGLWGTPEDIIRHKGILYIATQKGLFAIINDEIKQLEGINGQCWAFCEIVNPSNLKDRKLLCSGDSALWEINGTSLAKIKNVNVPNGFDIIQSQKQAELVYIAANNGLYVMRFVNNTWKWEGQVNGVNDNLRSVVEDVEGKLWLATSQNGIYKVEMSADVHNTQKTTHFTTKDGLPSLKNIRVFPFGDQVVFATKNGLIRFDDSQQKFVPKCSILPNLCDGSRDVFSFSVQANGNIWVSGLNSGMGEIGFAKNSNNAYSWINQPFKRIPKMKVRALYVENDGTAWIGGSEGLFRYHENERSFANDYNTAIRKVILGKDSVLYAGAFIKIKNGKKIQTLEQTEKEIPKIAYEYNTLTFKFSALTFNDENTNQYSFKLEGFDNEWSNWQQFPQKQYTNLRVGEYIFKVKSKNIYEEVGKTASFSFEILPPAHRSIWAYLFYVAIVMLLLYVFVKMYTKHLKLQILKLEKIVGQEENELKQNSKNETIKYEFDKAINYKVSVKYLVKTIYDNIKSFMDCAILNIGVYVPTVEALHFYEIHGKDENTSSYKSDLKEVNHIVFSCFNEDKELLINDIKKESEQNDIDLDKNIPNSQSRSMILVPVNLKGKVLGIVSVQSYNKDAFNKTHLDVLRNIALGLAIALDNEKLESEIEG